MTTSRGQTLRSSVKGQRPTTGTTEVGTLYVNFANLQLGVIDAGKAARDLVAVRYFSVASDYAIGDYAVQAGQLYRAKVAITAAAFNATQWDKLANQAELDAALATKVDVATYTPADVLAKLITVDGAGSGLDADKLDGNDSSYLLARANHTGTQAISSVSGLQPALDGKEPVIATGNPLWFWNGNKAFGPLPPIIPDVFVDGQSYVRKDAGWVTGSYGTSSAFTLTTGLGGTTRAFQFGLDGTLGLPVDPTAPAHAATKAYVDTGDAASKTYVDSKFPIPDEINSGFGVPTAVTGAPGDWYINLSDGRMYGPKTAGGAWPAVPVASGTDTPIQLLTKLTTVDGAGSGLDADFLDGQTGAYYTNPANLIGVVPPAKLPADLFTTDTSQTIDNAARKVVLTDADIAQGGASNWMFQSSATGMYALMTFHSPGSFACNFGMHPNGSFYKGGWSWGAAAYEFWDSQNTPLGDINSIANQATNYTLFTGQAIETRITQYYSAAVNQIMPTIAAQGTGGVGTYAFLRTNAINVGISEGGNYAGSTFLYSGINNGATQGGGVPVGAWRACGRINAIAASAGATVFLRYA